MAGDEKTHNEEKRVVRVMFGDRAIPRAPITDNTILIVPSKDSGWNDFKYRSWVDYSIRLRGPKQVLETSGYLGFAKSAEESNGIDLLQKLVRASGDSTLRATSDHKFFTLLPDMEAYRALIRQFGVDDAVNVLTALNDLVALNEFDPRSDVLDSATRTRIFSLSFMRNAETFFAYKNAGSLLRGMEGEQFGALSQNLAIKFQLAGRANAHELQFSFEHDAALPKRMAVIIGKNGVGKSQALGRIARAALEETELLRDGTDGGRPMISRLLAFAPTNEAGSVFPNDRRKLSRVWYRRFSMNRSRRSRRNEYVTDLVVQVARSPQMIGDKTRWEIFREALKAISDHDQLHLTTTQPYASHVALSRLTLESEQKLLEQFAAIDLQKDPVRVIDGNAYLLSSGEISFLKFAAQASLHIENGSLLLLDEPETHLHPNFISRFATLLDSLLASTGSAAIIATHSAYFVREVFREQVTVLSVDEENFVHCQRPMLRTFGADVGAISFFVFGEDQPTSLAAEVKARLLASGASWQEIYATYKDELSLDLLNSIRSEPETGGAN